MRSIRSSGHLSDPVSPVVPAASGSFLPGSFLPAPLEDGMLAAARRPNREV
jgi:hypothetical protein